MTTRSELDSRDAQQLEVLRRLEEDIIFGVMPPGCRLVEDVLMARYQVSRHCIRQSLVQLERKGIVRREKNVGATVCSYTEAEVHQVYEVREMLTRQAILMIQMPAENSFIESLRAIQARYGEYAEMGDLRGIHETNDLFHVTLFSACGNTFLASTLQDYMSLTLPMRATNLADRAGLDLSRRQHDLMIELLSGRDKWALAQLCVDHMRYSKESYLRRISSPAAYAVSS